MGVIIDSCVWVAAGGMVAPRAVIDAAGDAPVFISTISRRTGVRRAVLRRCGRARTPRRAPAPARAPACAGHHAPRRGRVRSAGRRRQQTGRSPRPRYNDRIAAQAIEHGYALMTLNVADFADLPGLSVIVPTSAGTS